MNVQLLLDPVARRHWLLTKALEIAPLAEALASAQAAEDFILGITAGIDDHTSQAIIPAATFGAAPEAATQLKRSSAVVGKDDQPLKMTEALAGLSSLAAIDDVILYLRQRGEVFVENESVEELLVRANLRRSEEGLPPFELLPTPRTKTISQGSRRRLLCLAPSPPR